MTFNSGNYPNGEMITLACGYISLTKIEFVNENITAEIEAKTISGFDFMCYDFENNCIVK